MRLKWLAILFGFLEIANSFPQHFHLILPRHTPPTTYGAPSGSGGYGYAAPRTTGGYRLTPSTTYGSPRPADNFHEILKSKTRYIITEAVDYPPSPPLVNIATTKPEQPSVLSPPPPPSPASPEPNFPGIPEIQTALTTLATAFSPKKEPILSRTFAPTTSIAKVDYSEVQKAIMVLNRYYMSKDNPTGGDIPGIPELQMALMTLSTALSDKEKEPILSNIFARVTSAALKAQTEKTSESMKIETFKPIPEASASVAADFLSTMEVVPAASNDIITGPYGVPGMYGGYGYGPPTGDSSSPGGGDMPVAPEAGDAKAEAHAAISKVIDGLISQLSAVLPGLVGTVAKAGKASLGIAGTVGTTALKKGGIGLTTFGQVAGALGNGFSATIEAKGDALNKIGGHVRSIFI